MKLVLVALTLAVFGYAYGERCTVGTDCLSTLCDAGSKVVCQHDSDDGGVTANGGLCTCADSTTGECVTAAECHGNSAPNLKCNDNARHCYDNKCICDRFPIGGKRMIAK